MKVEKCVLCGKSGSGKDHLLRGLVKIGLKYSPKITTRPKRKLEKNGREYFFMKNEKFQKLLESNKIKVYQDFLINDDVWYYAIDNKNFDENQVFIMTPHEISTLPKEDRKKCFIVYLDISYDVRKSRISRRNDNNDSIDRRMASDEEDFKDFKDYDLRITDPEFEIDMVYDLMF